MASSKSTVSDRGSVRSSDVFHSSPGTAVEDSHALQDRIDKGGFQWSALRDGYALLDNAAPDYTDATTDSDSNYHLPKKEVNGAFVYDSLGEDWASPTRVSLTGYASDGFRYTNGVKDSGPVVAPWSSETLSSVRGSGSSFPSLALIVWSVDYITIFDATDIQTDLKMWMRFNTGSGLMAQDTVLSVSMSNGVMAIVASEDRDGVMLVDFKGDTGFNTGHFISSSNHYRWDSDITTRNTSGHWTTSGVSPSLRLTSASSGNLDYSSVAIKGNVSQATCIVSGRVDTNLILIDQSIGAAPTVSRGMTESNKPEFESLRGGRTCLFDEFGWLWVSEGSIVQRNVHMAEHGSMVFETRDRPVRTRSGKNPMFKKINIGDPVTSMTSSMNYIYAATDRGVYKIDRGSLEFSLEYTIQGNGGVYEILTGDVGDIVFLSSFTTRMSGFLLVTTVNGVTMIRTLDNSVIGHVQPELCGSPTFNVGIMTP